jgi:hypothetical protein
MMTQLSASPTTSTPCQKLDGRQQHGNSRFPERWAISADLGRAARTRIGKSRRSAGLARRHGASRNS